MEIRNKTFRVGDDRLLCSGLEHEVRRGGAEEAGHTSANQEEMKTNVSMSSRDYEA